MVGEQGRVIGKRRTGNIPANKRGKASECTKKLVQNRIKWLSIRQLIVILDAIVHLLIIGNKLFKNLIHVCFLAHARMQPS